MLHEDMQHLLGDQQFSTVSILAAQVNQELNDRLRALEKIAKEVNPAILDDPAALLVLLEQHPILQGLFNGGTFVTGIEGTAIASTPLSIGLIDVNYMDRDFIATALNEGKATVGRPVMGKKLPTPVFSIGVPIRNTQGKVIGTLAGTTNLGVPNFMDKITENRYGKSGGYFLVASQYRLIVTASDKTRVMKQFPAPGVIPLLDRFIQGCEGSAVYVNPLGVEVLGSAKGIPVAGWFMGAILPTEEAFAPIRTMQQRMLLTTILLTLLAGSLTWWMTWWMLRRHLSPMLAATETLTTLSDTNQPPQPLPITSQDEIGQLIGGFNRLLETLALREEALRESEVKFRRIVESSPVAMYFYRLEFDERLVLTGANSSADRIIGINHPCLLGKTIEEAFPALAATEIPAIYRKVAKGELGPQSFEIPYKDERFSGCYDIHVFKTSTNNIAVYFVDITERKRAEAVKEKLEAQSRQLQKSESLGRMAGAIAHHFNNQLQVVMGYLEMAMDDLPLNVNPIEILVSAMQAARKAAEVSGLMLTYLGQMPGKREQMDLSEFCSRSLPMIQAVMPKNMILEADLHSSGLPVMANANQMQQVIINLITNAWEAVGQDRSSIHLRVKAVSSTDIPASHRHPLDLKQA